jgi:predicted ATPase
MLKRLQVRDFKSLRELEVEFGRLTVLVGANGCGKSSVLQAIELVRDLAQVPPTTVILDAELASRAGGTPAITVELDDADFNLAVEVVFSPSDQPSLGLDLDRSSIRYIPKNQAAEPSVKSFVKLRTPELATYFQHIRLYQLDTRLLASPSYSMDASPVLGGKGEHLGSVLDSLQGTRREQFEAIEGQLRKFIPGLRRVRLRRVSAPHARTVLVGGVFHQIKEPSIGHQVVFDFEFARDVPAAQSSEGTILLLGLLTVIGAEPGPPTTIMLDDLDRALHPKAQRQLVEHLHQLLDQRPELQIIATSHSPYLVEHLTYDEVRAMTQSPVDGRSLIAPLADHPDAERWRDEMSAGEFWSSVGEDWINTSTAR